MLLLSLEHNFGDIVVNESKHAFKHCKRVALECARPCLKPIKGLLGVVIYHEVRITSRLLEKLKLLQVCFLFPRALDVGSQRITAVLNHRITAYQVIMSRCHI